MASPSRFCSKEAPMASSSKNTPVPASREEQVEELMQQLRPKMEEALRHMVERAVDTPEHEEVVLRQVPEGDVRIQARSCSCQRLAVRGEDQPRNHMTAFGLQLVLELPGLHVPHS